MDGYEIEKIDEGLWAIDDKMGCSMYLVEGKNKALLVDTGVQEGKILPMLKSLTDKPISLALTHAHIDHMYHADEFEEVYLHERDIKAWHGGNYVCFWDRLCFVSSIRSIGSRSIFPLLTRLSST